MYNFALVKKHSNFTGFFIKSQKRIEKINKQS